MRPNPIRDLWGQGKVILNSWLAIPNGFSAELMARQGWDTITIDMQHGMVDYQSVLPMLISISTTDVAPMVRVPWNEPSIIMKVLDSGAYGIIAPMVNTVAEAEALASAAHYPPQGRRSFGPTRAVHYAGADYASKANDVIVVFAMIETREGLDNLEEILKVPGIDAIYVGPSDLSLSLGCQAKLDGLDKEAAEAVEHIRVKTQESGKFIGIHTGSTQGALVRVEEGFNLVTVGSDVRFILAGAQEAVKTMRQVL